MSQSRAAAQSRASPVFAGTSKELCQEHDREALTQARLRLINGSIS